MICVLHVQKKSRSSLHSGIHMLRIVSSFFPLLVPRCVTTISSCCKDALVQKIINMKRASSEDGDAGRWVRPRTSAESWFNFRHSEVFDGESLDSWQAN